MTASNKYSKDDILLASGFIRCYSYSMQSVIIPIIVQYFMDVFEWHTKECGDNISFSMDNTYVTSESEMAFDIWAAENFICRKKYRMVEWEVTVKKIPEQLIYFAMGYVQHPVSESISKWNYYWLGEGNEKQEGCIHVCQVENKFQIYDGNNTVIVKHNKALPSNVKIGDRFEIRFDFDGNQSLFYYNGEFMQVMFDSLPDSGNIPLVPAMCCVYEHAFQTTKWNIHYR